VGTGINMSSMASSIAVAEYASQTSAVTSQLSNVAIKISEASQMKSDLLSLSSSLSSLIDGGGLVPTPTVTNSNVATASVPTGSSGGSGTYTLEVTTLAAPQTLGTSNISSSSTFKGGTLTFNFGTVTAGTSTTTNGVTTTTAGSFSQDSSHTSASVTMAPR
jgi:flagellar hook-associated protein 2